MPTVSQLKDRAHALLEKEGRLESRMRPIEISLVKLKDDLNEVQTKIRNRTSRMSEETVERLRDRAARILARIEKAERRLKPLKEKLRENKERYDKVRAQYTSGLG